MRQRSSMKRVVHAPPLFSAKSHEFATAAHSISCAAARSVRAPLHREFEQHLDRLLVAWANVLRERATHCAGVCAPLALTRTSSGFGSIFACRVSRDALIRSNRCAPPFFSLLGRWAISRTPTVQMHALRAASALTTALKSDIRRKPRSSAESFRKHSPPPFGARPFRSKAFG